MMFFPIHRFTSLVHLRAPLHNVDMTIIFSITTERHLTEQNSMAIKIELTQPERQKSVVSLYYEIFFSTLSI
jgi:hypothetical protein